MNKNLHLLRVIGIRAVALAAVLVLGATNCDAAVIFEAGGNATTASIQPTVDAFRAGLGTLNPNQPVSFTGGRREINWDGVPAGSQNPFPGNFFNGNVVGRARGIEFATPGTALAVSGAAGDPTFEFGDVTDAGYGVTEFASFSPAKLFAPLGSNLTDVLFFLPGTTTPAVSLGFGAVFVDVEYTTSTRMDFYDKDGNLLLSRGVLPSSTSSEGFSFLGAIFDTPSLFRVRITSGDAAIDAISATSSFDAVVMDDFIYGEPTALAAVPEAGTMALVAGGLLAAGLLKRRRN